MTRIEAYNAGLNRPTTATVLLMTDRQLEIAYNQASIMGLGERCDELLAEIDRRAFVRDITA